MKELSKGQYFGLKDKHVEYNGLVLSQYRYQIRDVDWHYHANPYFMLILKGGLLDVDKKRTLQCSSGSLVFHNQQEPHRNSCHVEGTYGFHLELSEQWMERNEFAGRLREGSSTLQDLQLQNITSQIHYEFCLDDPDSAVTIDSLVRNACSLLGQAQDPPLRRTDAPIWTTKLKELIQDDPNVHDLSALADHADIHPSHLSRAFPMHFGCNLGEYIRSVRVSKAADLLRTTNLTATEISYACGFSDQSHLTRCFKQRFNVTPARYRRVLGKR